MMTNKEFFRAMFGKCKDSKITLMQIPENVIKHFKTDELDKFEEEAVKLGAKSNVHMSMEPRIEEISEGLRGGSNDTKYMVCLFSDMDVAGLAHTDVGLPETKELVLEYLKKLQKPPTVIIDSGYGEYPIWILKNPVLLTEEGMRKKANGILRGFGSHLIREFGKKGWTLDNVFDPARMLRVPGSNNCKLKDHVPCRIVWDSGIFYALDDFAEYYEEPVSVNEAEPFIVDARVIGSADRILEGCQFVQKMLKDPCGVTEPEWKAMCSNVALAPDGEEKFHDWSSPYGGYSTSETEYKLARSKEAKKPCTCMYIRDRLGFDCPDGGCGVKAPIVLSILSKEEQIKNLLAREKLTVDDVFEEYAIELMAYAKNKSIQDYVQFKQRLKRAKISTRDFERAVNKWLPEKPTDAAEDFSSEPMEIRFAGIELNGAMAPKGYVVSKENGVEALRYDGTGGFSHICVSPEPLAVLKHLENIDSGQERIEVVYYRNNRWKHLIAPRSGIFNKNAIIRFADNGLPVTSDTSEEVVRYLSEYEKTNSKIIPFTRSINRIGWLGKEFYPCFVDSEVIYEGESSEGKDVVQSICENGDYDIWLEYAKKLRESVFARAQMAASYASPLLEQMKSRVIIIHIWYSSRSGKTAGLKFALSIWGDPLKLMGNFNSTAVGLERRAGTLKHLPLGLDELQVLNERRLSPSMIVYALGNGYGKTRGSKNGGLQDVPTWRNCIISTGEQPLSSESSMDGVSSRVLELYGSPIEDTEIGRKVHQISESNYGFAGKKYIEYIIRQVISDKEKMRNDFNRLRDEMKSHYEILDMGDPGVHLDNIAMLSLADKYSGIALFGMTEEEAHRSALQFGTALLMNAKEMEKEDIVERAWSFVQDWAASNKSRFFSGINPCFGMRDNNKVYIISSCLRQALEDNGFSYTKCIKGFQERGYIGTFEDSQGKKRSQMQKRIQGVNVRAICANFTIQEDSGAVEEDFLGG